MKQITIPQRVPIVSELSPEARRVVPIPHDLPVPDLSRGTGWEATYRYCDAAGALVGLVARYTRRAHDAGRSSKMILPLTLWEEPGCGPVYARKALPESRPLYRLPELLARPEAPVIISEGEKCADRVSGAFPDSVSVTWCGGTNALRLTDCTPLAGRDILICPDHDEPGMKAAQDLVDVLREVGVARLRMLDIAELGKAVSGAPFRGYDIADAIEDGLTPDKLRALIEASPQMLHEIPMIAGPALAEAEPTVGRDCPFAQYLRRHWDMDLELPDGFDLDETGIYQTSFDRKGQELVTYAGSPFLVLGRTRTARDGAGWGYMLAVQTPTNAWEVTVIPARMLAGDGREVREELARLGAICPHDRAGRQALAEYISHGRASAIIDVAAQPGWNAVGFALPQEVIPLPGSDRRLHLDIDGREHRFEQGGTLEGWQKMSRCAEANSRLAFALSTGFAGPLLKLLSIEGGAFHLWGPSSRGKSSIQRLAGSVWGWNFPRSWRATANGLEGIAADHNDTLLVLDELREMDPDQLSEALYMLANGGEKPRWQDRGSPAHGAMADRRAVIRRDHHSGAYPRRSARRQRPGHRRAGRACCRHPRRNLDDALESVREPRCVPLRSSPKRVHLGRRTARLRARRASLCPGPARGSRPKHRTRIAARRSVPGAGGRRRR